MPEAAPRPAPSEPPDHETAVAAAVADIEFQFASYMPRPERVAEDCACLRRAGAWATTGGRPDWLARLLPLPARRAGAVVVPLFEWLEEMAAAAPDAWPFLDAMLGSQDAALQRRAVASLARAAQEGRVVLSPAVIEAIALAVDREGSGLAAPEPLRAIGAVLTRAATLTELLAQRVSPAVQRLAARVLDLDGTPPPDQVVRRVLGEEAASLLAPHLLFTRATHLDLAALAPASRHGAVLDSFRRAAAVLGERLLSDVVAALGWPRVNLGLEATKVAGISLADGFPFLLDEAEAPLLESLPGGRRVFERHLVVAAGGDAGAGGGARAPSGQAEPDSLSRFRAYNVLHADLLNDILDVAPLTRARLESILAKTASLVADFQALFGAASDPAVRAEAEALVRVHASLRARALEALAVAGDDPLPMEVCRLVQPFEDPDAPDRIRTLHGLKRYLHQRGLKLAFSLIGSGPKTTRTVDLAVVGPGRAIEVGRHIEFVDLEGGDAAAVPHPVRLVADAFARQMLHAQPVPSHVRVFCYGTEVQYFARFRNHPAFVRIDYSPPLRGGMIDLQYLGVSNYELDVHPRLSLDAIRRFFLHLDFIVTVDATSIHARYDKERAVTIDELHRRAGLLFHLVPYLMDVDWTIGSLRLSDASRDLAADAWAGFFGRWGVLPYRQFLTRDRSSVLAGLEMTPEGVREARWDGRPPYRDRFSTAVTDEMAAALQARVSELGLETGPPVTRGDLQGQLALEDRVLGPLRAALARGEVVSTASGLRRRPASCFERVHEAELLAALLESDPGAIAAGAHLAQIVPLIERHVRFRRMGSVNGCVVDRARVPLGDGAIALCVLRDGSGMPRLARASSDEHWWRRRESPWDDWEVSGALTAEAVMALLRRHNVVGAAPEPFAMEPDALAEELRQAFRATGRAGLHPWVEGERVAEGVSASPGRAAGIARLGAGGRDARDLRGAVLVAAGLDPRDAPCLLHVAAVAATGGGILSHLGLLAVESGKPAVIIDGRWETTARGEPALVFGTEEYDRREREVGPYHLVERHRVREVRHVIHDGDLVVVDADLGTFTLLGHDPSTLALHEALRQHAEASALVERAADDERLVARGHHLRTRHQAEKALARAQTAAVIRFAVEEVLLAPAWAATHTALQDGVALLRRLASRDAVAGVARAATLDVTERLAARVRDARAQAVQSIPTAATPHDVLALRLAARRLHDTLARVAGALEDGGLDAGVVAAGGQQDLDVLACKRLLDMRVELVRSLDDERLAGGRHARLTELQRVGEVLRIEQPRPEAAATGPNRSPENRLRPEAAISYVVTPHDAGIDLVSRAGAKAANLAEVARVLGDDAVPGWFAVTDDAFQDVLDLPATSVAGAPALRMAIDGVLRDASIGPVAQSAAIRSLFDGLTLPPRLAEAVAGAYRAIGGDGHVAVRSSSRDEDAERASRAGQFDTFLFVRGADSVLHHLTLVWSGLWTARALAHAAAARGAAANPPHCGVIVQRMVASRVSGVMQTVNAAQGRPLEIVINVGLGLGEGIVSGAVAADLVTVAKGDPGDAALRFRYLTADKRQRVVFDRQLGQGTIRTDTLAHQRLRPALEYPELRELVDTALRLERAYARPLDIEFGFEESRLFVLQARPVPASLSVWAETRERFPLAPRAGGREGQP